MRTEAIYSDLAIARESGPSFAFDRSSKADRGVGKLYKSGKKGKVSGILWRLLAWESWSPATRIREYFISLVWGAYLAFSDWSQVESRGKNREVGSH